MKFAKKINILLLGSGAREHAIARSLAKSDKVATLYIAPGNGGTSDVGINLPDVEVTNFSAIKQVVLQNSINLVVVGPEDPLVKGIFDFFVNDDELHLVPVVGPSAEGAKLEGSKDFAKKFMCENNIPTAKYQSFSKDTLQKGYAFLDSLEAPYVLKADGLAAGKGVLICEDINEAKEELEKMLAGKFGAASGTVVIEEFLKGIEVSIFVATDGVGYKILPEAKDYKRIGEGDTGLNTGGMGAVSPVPFADAEFMEKVRTRVIEPTVKGLANRKIAYNGFLFIGLMNVGGDPYVIEYNVRMGDPETEVVFPRIESDVVDLFEGIVYKSLNSKELNVSSDTAVTVVCVSGGYPEEFQKNFPVKGLVTVTESTVFHGGTKKLGKEIVTSGGRVLAVTSLAKTREEALTKSYNSIAKIEYQQKYFRTDIGKDFCED